MPYRIAALTRDDVRRAAAYLAGAEGEPAIDTLTAHWTWLLFDNPAGTAAERGQLVVDETDTVRGIQLAIPQRFRSPEGTRLGLCSSAFYVDAAARLQGFLMYRRFRAQPADFWFATTSNQVAGENARRNGFQPVMAASRELIIPIRPGRAMAAYVRHPPLRPVVAAAGNAAGPLLRALRRRHGGRVTLRGNDHGPDWGALAGLADRHAGATLTAVRDVPYLTWRYGGPGAAARRIWRAHDAHGRDGWVTAARFTRAFASEVRSWMILDYVWPGDADPTALLLAAADAVADEADLLAVRGRVGRHLADSRVLGLRRTFPHAPAWVSPPVDPATLDLVPADGDTAP